MNIQNYTDYVANFGPGMLPDGRICLIVVVKATYDFPAEEGLELMLAENQISIYDSDEFIGEPGYSSPLYENDYATLKPRCDVIICNAIAHAPDNEPAQRVEVGLQIASINKTFVVTGPRYWEQSSLGLARASQPEPFTQQKISWEISYGGTDDTAYEEEGLSESYLPNPVGCGYWYKPTLGKIVNSPIAQTEEKDQPIDKPKARFKPRGFGPIGRNWHPRSDYCGTYDKSWEQNTKPFLPHDFNALYYQCAPEDQQMNYPSGGEIITLKNLSPEGGLQFSIPSFDFPIEVQLSNGDSEMLDYAIDTVTIDMEKRQLSLVARALKPLKNSIHEIGAFIVGVRPETDVDEDDEDELEPDIYVLAAAEYKKNTEANKASNTNVIQFYNVNKSDKNDPQGGTL
ncbi:hypothetical protein TDB9533_00853 [Thalassocella blandensis]|nr:hypothetical protein TDB9533_00853 [Thalassocella blandensis]